MLCYWLEPAYAFKQGSIDLVEPNKLVLELLALHGMHPSLPTLNTVLRGMLLRSAESSALALACASCMMVNMRGSTPLLAKLPTRPALQAEG